MQQGLHVVGNSGALHKVPKKVDRLKSGTDLGVVLLFLTMLRLGLCQIRVDRLSSAPYEELHCYQRREDPAAR